MINLFIYNFFRTGQRTKAGALQDLSNSITRYVKNNFLDGSRQDSFDLFLGRYKLESDQLATTRNPFKEEKPLRVRVVSWTHLLFLIYLSTYFFFYIRYLISFYLHSLCFH